MNGNELLVVWLILIIFFCFSRLLLARVPECPACKTNEWVYMDKETLEWTCEKCGRRPSHEYYT